MLNRLWPFGRRQDNSPDTAICLDLAAPVLQMGSQAMSWARLCCGVFIAGITGSGKTTSSATDIALSMLRHKARPGGLILSVKNERPMWERLCKLAGRSDDLVVFDASGRWKFNPIDYEVKRKGPGAGLTESVVHFLMTLLDVAGRSSGNGRGREDEGYWRQALKQLLRNAIDLLILATGGVTVSGLYQIVISAPTSRDQSKSAEWRASSPCFTTLTGADKKPKSERQQRDFELVVDYFLVEFAALSDKTRSVIVSTFTSLIDCCNRGLLRDLFCEDSNITPEAIEEGKIIVVDLPIKEYGQMGLFANLFWKLSFQRSIERRDVRQSPRPVILWMDEGHYVLHHEDCQFQSTARGSRVITVLITQNIPNLDVALGGSDVGRAASESLIANFGTMIFHCNTCQRTNEFASGLIGRSVQVLANGNSSYQTDDWAMTALGFGGSGQSSGGFSEHWEACVQPAEFTRLRTGGPPHWECDAIVVQSGTTFADTGRIWAPITFRQNV